MSDKENIATFLHTHRDGKQYVLKKADGEKLYVLGVVKEWLPKKPENENSENIVELGWHNPKTEGYAIFEEIPDELKKEILNI